jgi:hypothetical protein
MMVLGDKVLLCARHEVSNLFWTFYCLLDWKWGPVNLRTLHRFGHFRSVVQYAVFAEFLALKPHISSFPIAMCNCQQRIGQGGKKLDTFMVFYAQAEG